MAALQERNGSDRILFNYHRNQRVFTLDRVTEAEARAKASQVDYLLMRLKQGLIEIPPGIDVLAFFRHDEAPPTNTPPPLRRGRS